MKRQVEIRVVDRLLNDPPVYLEKYCASRLGILNCTANRLLKQISVYWTIDATK